MLIRRWASIFNVSKPIVMVPNNPACYGSLIHCKLKSLRLCKKDDELCGTSTYIIMLTYDNGPISMIHLVCIALYKNEP